MLNFVKHYYEVTDENINQLKYLIKAEDIRDYDGHKVDIDGFVTVGHVLGNNHPFDGNPKHTGLWREKGWMNSFDLKKVTTKVPNMVMTIE